MNYAVSDKRAFELTS